MDQVRWNNVQGAFIYLCVATYTCSCGLVVSVAVPSMDPKGVLNLVD